MKQAVMPLEGESLELCQDGRFFLFCFHSVESRSSLALRPFAFSHHSSQSFTEYGAALANYQMLMFSQSEGWCMYFQGKAISNII